MISARMLSTNCRLDQDRALLQVHATVGITLSSGLSAQSLDSVLNVMYGVH